MNWKKQKYSKIKGVKDLKVGKTYKIDISGSLYEMKVKKINDGLVYFSYVIIRNGDKGDVNYPVDTINKYLERETWVLTII